MLADARSCRRRIDSVDLLAIKLLAIKQYIDYSRHMDKGGAIASLAALAQSTRLEAFRLLVEHEPDGLPAGEIARRLAVPHNTMSTHLAVLTRAGLIGAERRSQSIIYRARLDGFRVVASYLLKDCCGGRPEICAPLISELAPCCTPREAAHG
jgi:DNA-binding transcriptional ArsR family regulator